MENLPSRHPVRGQRQLRHLAHDLYHRNFGSCLSLYLYFSFRRYPDRALPPGQESAAADFSRPFAGYSQFCRGSAAELLSAISQRTAIYPHAASGRNRGPEGLADGLHPAVRSRNPRQAENHQQLAVSARDGGHDDPVHLPSPVSRNHRHLPGPDGRVLRVPGGRRRQAGGFFKQLELSRAVSSPVRPFHRLRNPVPCSKNGSIKSHGIQSPMSTSARS